MLVHCPLCNSEHEQGAFDVGYFLIDGKVVTVHGEENVWAKARDPEFASFEVFWSREAVEHRIAWEREVAEDAEFQAAIAAVKTEEFRAKGRVAKAALEDGSPEAIMGAARLLNGNGD